MFIVVTVTAPTEPAATSFLVERYLPVGDVEGLARAVTRVALACSAGIAAGIDVRYLHSTFVADEDTCFCVFQAPSADAVRAVNEAADFPVDRISAAVSLPTECRTVGL